jgi:hypothetical protein
MITDGRESKWEATQSLAGDMGNKGKILAVENREQTGQKISNL